MAHPAITMAIVIGVKDAHYGEVVGAFLDTNNNDGEGRPGKEEIRDWVTRRLGKHKAPTHVFWLGEGGVPRDVPLTGSGKVRKVDMAKLAHEVLQSQDRKMAKL